MAPLVVLAVVSWAAPASRAANLLYPNLKTLTPRDLRFDRADVDASEATVMHNVLRFSNTVWNSGQGPLEVRGLIDPATKTGPATQRVYDDARGFSDLSAGSFYYHPAHQHYHYDNWGRYELWTKAGYEAWLASGRTVGNPTVGAKTTSCMMDEEFIRNVPNQPYPPAYGSEGCFPDSNGKMSQGISPGWGDTYDYFRFEQWIDLGPSGSLPDGQYVLRSVVDPTNKIYESPSKANPLDEGEEDNEAITPFSVNNGQLVDSNPPSGSVRINDIDASTPTPNVTVRVLGRDDISGVAQVRLSNDGNSWAAPIAYTGKESTAQSINWNLVDPAYGGNSFDGTKTVYAQFEDATGKWSAPESDTILLDRAGGSSAYSNAVEADNPVGYWRLGEKSGTTANDVAGTNSGTYKNGTLLDQPSLLAGDPNPAARFDGSNDYVSVSSSPSLNPSAKVSIEAWIKPSFLPAEGNFASIASKPESYSLQFNGPRLEFTIMQSGNRRRLQAPAGAIVPNQAYHVVGTYDGTIQRLYVNGAELASTPLSGPITTNDANGLDFGSWNEGAEAFNGTIDEVAVYAGALSAARVAAHYETGSGIAPPDPTVKDPSNLSATAASETRIELKWTDNSANEGEFLIQRDTSPSFTAPVVLSAWANSTSFSDTGLSPGMTYYYRVRARNATDSSGYSNTANATTLSSLQPPLTGQGEAARPPSQAPPPLRQLSFPASGYPAVVMDDEPTAYWRLDEKSGGEARDARGASPGLYKGDPQLGRVSLLPADAAIISDSSVRFDGVDDHVEVSGSSSLSPDRVSVEAWIEAATLPRGRHIAVIAGKHGSYSLELSGPQLQLRVWLAGRAFRLRAPVGVIEARRVEHVVGVYDGSTLRLFVNGQRVAAARQTGPMASGDRPFEIGSAGGSRQAFSGGIDEVAVYGRALSAARVAAHYRAGAPSRSRTARRSRAVLANSYASAIAVPTYYCHLWAADVRAAKAIAIAPLPSWLRPQS